jgi:RNA polymerase sigma-70 factor (ECF subfamily)
VPDLETRLTEMLEAAHRAWPEVRVDDEAFLRYLAERVTAGPDPVGSFGRVHAADLYLACGCARGDAPAVRSFEDGFVAPLTAYLAGREPPATTVDEIKQNVRATLLVRRDDQPPRIAGYSGQGPLAAWLRIVAARAAGQIRRTQKEQAPFDGDSPLFIEAPGPDVELAYLKSRYRPEVEEAFRTTLAALSPRDRAILSLHFIDGLNAQAIATAYKTSKRTAERWLAGARERILDETRRLLAERLRIAPSQLDTLMALVHSQIDVSIHHVLQRTR